MFCGKKLQNFQETSVGETNKPGNPTNHFKLVEQMPGEDLIHAKTLWDYLLLHHELRKSDVIMLLGNNDIRTAEHAAQLYLLGYGDWLVISGKAGNMTKGKWKRPEAHVFRDVALDIGVPENRIIVENQATNTGENIKFSYKIMKKYNLKPSSIILVQTPYMERRTYATFMKQWPGNAALLRVTVTSPSIPFRLYPIRDVCSVRELLAAMLGVLQRIQVYPRIGFQIYQTIPSEVIVAYDDLVRTGRYNDFIMKN
ncbi:uncharacterized protein LOC106474937 [Limulus polyphemus]|uniref:Uncharacterized protein LOC106474937 n=1 Tax=Limulus polyphemus TaxID=6850 RepID=A0ABM1BYI1_LIMPO|nr:uncharacterized protein LOC106474937 [Limulus polyphemus]